MQYSKTWHSPRQNFALPDMFRCSRVTTAENVIADKIKAAVGLQPLLLLKKNTFLNNLYFSIEKYKKVLYNSGVVFITGEYL